VPLCKRNSLYRLVDERLETTNRDYKEQR